MATGYISAGIQIVSCYQLRLRNRVGKSHQCFLFGMEGSTRCGRVLLFAEVASVLLFLCLGNGIFLRSHNRGKGFGCDVSGFGGIGKCSNRKGYIFQYAWFP